MSGYKKIAISPEQFSRDSTELGLMVFEDFQPEVILGVYNRGTMVAGYVAGVLKAKGVNCEVFPIKVRSYRGLGDQKTVQMYGLTETLEILRLNGYERLLVTDDIGDSLKTYHAIRTVLTRGVKVSDGNPIKVPKKHGFGIYGYDFFSGVEHYPVEIMLERDIERIGAEVKFGVNYWKPYANRTTMKPDFYVRKFDRDDGGLPWLVFANEPEDHLDDKDWFFRAFPHLNDLRF